jgi:hypothetical protein
MMTDGNNGNDFVDYPATVRPSRDTGFTVLDPANSRIDFSLNQVAEAVLPVEMEEDDRPNDQVDELCQQVEGIDLNCQEANLEYYTSPKHYYQFEHFTN